MTSMTSRRRLIAATCAAASVMFGSALGAASAQAAYPTGWTDIAGTCAEAPVVGATVPITDRANHTTSSSPWVKVNAQQAGQLTGYQSYVVAFDTARVTSVQCTNGRLAVRKVYDSGIVTTTNRVDWSHSGGTSPQVLNRHTDRMAFSALTCHHNWCAPTATLNP